MPSLYRARLMRGLPRTAPPALGALTLSSATFAAGTAAGTVVGAIQNKTSGSTLSLTDDHSGAVALSGTNLVVGVSAPGSAGSFSITVRETLVGATGTPRDTTLTITVNPAVDITPDAFTITSVTGATPLTQQTGSVTLSGFNATVIWIGNGVSISTDGGLTYSPFANIPAPGTFPVKAASPSANTTTVYAPTAGGVAGSWSIGSGAAISSGADILSIHGPSGSNKLYAWFDWTDATTMFTDVAGTVPIDPAGNTAARTVAAIRAKNNSSLMLVQATSTKRAVFSNTAYNGGLAPGVTFDGVDDFYTMAGVAAFVDDETWSCIFSGTLTGQSETAIAALYSSTAIAGGTNYFDALDRIGLLHASRSQGKLFVYYNSNYSMDFAPDLTGPVRVSTEKNGTSVAGYISGSSTPAHSSSTYGDLTVGSNATLSFMGAVQGNAVCTGAVQHLALLTDAQTNSERAAVDDYLAGEVGGSTYAVPLDSTNTTGSITSGSSTLTVASGTGLTNGKTILIEPTTGYGTVGPGGVWPTLSASNEAAILALTSSVADEWIRALDTGKIYKARSNGSGYNAWDPNLWYTRYCIPLPLVTTITSGGGTTTLTLASPSQATVSGTLVAVDNKAILDAMTGPAGATFNLPSGTFWCSGGTQIVGKTGWTVQGAGKLNTILKLCRGAAPSAIDVASCNSVDIKDMQWVGNHDYDGRTGVSYAGNKSNGYGKGISLRISSDCTVTDVICKDFPSLSFYMEYCVPGSRGLKAYDGTTTIGAKMLRCEAQLSKAGQHYRAEWHVEASSTFEPIEYNQCGFVGAFRSPGIETFGSTGAIFYKCYTVNGDVAVNSATAFKFIELSMDYTAGCRDLTVYAPTSNQGAVNINSNISNTSGIGFASANGYISIDHIIMAGWQDSLGSVNAALNIVPPGVVVEGAGGGYSTTTAGSYKGLIKAPPRKMGLVEGAPGNPNYGSVSGPSITVGTSNATIRGLRFAWVTGLSGADTYPIFPASIQVYGSQTGITIQNTITGVGSVDIGAPAGATLSGNISNVAADGLGITP